MKFILLGATAFAALAWSRVPTPSPTPTPTPTRTHVVRMQGGRFAPYEITIQQGDTVRFVLGSGGPHNVAFREIKGEAAERLRKRMTDTIGTLSGPLLLTPGETYDIVFTDVPSGVYPYWCIPHFSMGQMGAITVK